MPDDRLLPDDHAAHEAVRQDDPVLRERLKELARVRRSFGTRRLHIFLRREVHEINHKRLFRIYREERLRIRAPVHSLRL